MGKLPLVPFRHAFIVQFIRLQKNVNLEQLPTVRQLFMSERP